MNPEERLANADDMLLKAIQQVEKDPRGPLSLARANVLASIATALLLREILYRNDGEQPAPPRGERQGPPW